MKITMISQKESITTKEEIVTDTTVSKWLNALGTLLVLAGMIIWFIILGRNEVDLLTTKQTVILCTGAIVCIGVGAWFEMKSQRHQKVQTFADYIHDDYDDGDCYDYDDYIDDSFDSDFPDEGQGRKGGTYYGNE